MRFVRSRSLPESGWRAGGTQQRSDGAPPSGHTPPHRQPLPGVHGPEHRVARARLVGRRHHHRPGHLKARHGGGSTGPPRPRESRDPFYIAMAIAAVIALVAVTVIYERATSAADTPVFQVGVTHTQYSADAWNPQPSVTRARAVLRAVAPVQNQHLMGWGALNPEPRPGAFDFHSLDARMGVITA